MWIAIGIVVLILIILFCLNIYTVTGIMATPMKNEKDLSDPKQTVLEYVSWDGDKRFFAIRNNILFEGKYKWFMLPVVSIKYSTKGDLNSKWTVTMIGPKKFYHQQKDAQGGHENTNICHTLHNYEAIPAFRCSYF